MAEEQAASEAPRQSAMGGGGSGMIPALLFIALMPVIEEVSSSIVLGKYSSSDRPTESIVNKQVTQPRITQ